MKILSRAICGYLLLSLTISLPFAFGQLPARYDDQSYERARAFTDEIVKDGAALTNFDRAVLWARLGEYWWKDDRQQARAWIRKSVKELEAAPQQEDAADRARRHAAARSVLRIVAPRDKAMGDRVAAIFTTNTEQMSLSERRENAGALIDAALGVVGANPQRALEYGLASLRASASPRIGSLLAKLRRRDDKLGDRLFIEVLAVARASYDREILATLSVVAFKGAVPSDELRKKLLEVISEGLLRAPNSPGDEAAICALAPNAATLLNEFNRLLPQQAGQVRLAITRCQSSLATSDRRQVEELLDDNPLKTVDDLMQAASKAADLQTRDQFLERAAYKAAQQREYDRAVTFLDDISAEGQARMSGAWESWRWEFASSSAFVRFKLEDLYGMRQVINATPARLRPFVQITLAEKFNHLNNPSLARELIQEARKGMARVTPADAPDGYLILVRLYGDLLPTDAAAVFRETVVAMNRAKQQSGTLLPKGDSESMLLTNDLLLKSFNLSFPILEADDFDVRQTISSIESPIKRAAIRLNLLASSLERRRSQKSPRKPVL
jgi:hypothetical protein